MSEPASTPPSKYVRVDVSPARVARVWAGVSNRLETAPTGRRHWAYRGALAATLVALAVGVTGRALWEHQATRSALANSALETAGDAMAMGLDDGSRLEIAAHTKVRVTGNDPQTMALNLDHGRVDCDITPRPGRRFTVAAAGVTVRVKGTKFGVELAPARDRVDVDVERGVVEVTWQDQHRDLAAGERWSIDLQHPEANLAATAAAVASGETVEPSASGEAEVAPAESSKAPGASAKPSHEAAPGARELLDLGNAARRAGDVAGAAKAYEELLTLHPSDGRAGLAAFELGRLKMDRLGDVKGAIQALQKAVMMAPGAGFREDAMARLVEAYARAGAVERCRSAQSAYLSSYPNGVHATAVSRGCQSR
ncbi:MAG TPA: FecR domain-containing protein [Polyangiaceae bacterium]|nr:FecR domain-containing protein [Polyangiaceae bacterium]